MTAQAPGNRLYLVCAAHPDEDPLMLGKRLQGAYGRPPSAHEINAWFDDHAQCAGAPDCFKLAYAQPQNYDVDAPVEPTQHVGAAVRLALVK